MADSNALATIRPDTAPAVVPTPRNHALVNLSIPDMMTLAGSLVGTGFIPTSIKTKEQALAIMLKGQELGLPPMAALGGLYSIGGNVSCKADLALALVQREVGTNAMRVAHTDAESCTIEYRVPGWQGVQTYTYTMADAKKGPATSNANYQKYPDAMLRARAISAVARMAFPGALAGMYVVGELGEEVTLDSQGEVTPLFTHTVEVVDQETGEITDQPGLNRERVMKRLHAVAREAGIKHEQLSKWAKDKRNLASLTLVETETLNELANWIDEDHKRAYKAFNPTAKKPEPEVEETADAPEPVQETTEAETVEEPDLFD